MANESGISPSRKVVAIAAVRRFLAVQFFSAFSRSLLKATIAWPLWKLTESVFMLGVTGFVHERRPELRDFEVQPVEANATGRIGNVHASRSRVPGSVCFGCSPGRFSRHPRCVPCDVLSEGGSPVFVQGRGIRERVALR